MHVLTERYNKPNYCKILPKTSLAGSAKWRMNIEPLWTLALKEIIMMTMMMKKVNLKSCNVQIYDSTTLAVLYIVPNVDFGSGRVIPNWLQTTRIRALLPWFDDCPTVFIAGLWRIAALALLDFCLYQEKRELDKNSSLKSPLKKFDWHVELDRNVMYGS